MIEQMLEGCKYSDFSTLRLIGEKIARFKTYTQRKKLVK